MPAHPPWSKAWVRGCTSRRWASCDWCFVCLILFSSVQGGICALRKTHMCTTPSHRNIPSVAFETVPVFISLVMALSEFMGDLFLILQTISVHSQNTFWTGCFKAKLQVFILISLSFWAEKVLRRLVPLTVWLFCPQSFPFCCRNCNQQSQSHWTSFQCLKMFF